MVQILKENLICKPQGKTSDLKFFNMAEVLLASKGNSWNPYTYKIGQCCMWS